METIIRPFTLNDLQHLVSAYRRFSEPPWNEVLDDESTANMFRGLHERRADILVAETMENRQFMGFAVGVPLSSRPDIAQHIPSPTGSHARMLYLAELVVLERFEHRDMGMQLTEARIQRFADRFDIERFLVVARLTTANPHAATNYKRLGMSESVEVEVKTLKTTKRGPKMLPDKREIRYGHVSRRANKHTHPPPP